MTTVGRPSVLCSRRRSSLPRYSCSGFGTLRGALTGLLTAVGDAYTGFTMPVKSSATWEERNGLSLTAVRVRAGATTAEEEETKEEDTNEDERSEDGVEKVLNEEELNEEPKVAAVELEEVPHSPKESSRSMVGDTARKFDGMVAEARRGAPMGRSSPVAVPSSIEKAKLVDVM